jgi:hypothetical protein
MFEIKRDVLPIGGYQDHRFVQSMCEPEFIKNVWIPRSEFSNQYLSAVYSRPNLIDDFSCAENISVSAYRPQPRRTSPHHSRSILSRHSVQLWPLGYAELFRRHAWGIWQSRPCLRRETEVASLYRPSLPFLIFGLYELASSFLVSQPRFRLRCSYTCLPPLRAPYNSDVHNQRQLFARDRAFQVGAFR